MNSLNLFMPCAAGVEGFLADEVHAITGLTGQDLMTGRGGVMARASWRDAMRINLHSRLTQRVLVQLSVTGTAEMRRSRSMRATASAGASGGTPSELLQPAPLRLLHQLPSASVSLASLSAASVASTGGCRLAAGRPATGRRKRSTGLGVIGWVACGRTCWTSFLATAP